MDQEEKDREAAELFVYCNENFINLSGKKLVERRVADFVAGISYGRQADRERLKRFAQHMYEYVSVYLSVPDGENVVIDQFLQSEKEQHESGKEG